MIYWTRQRDTSSPFIPPFGPDTLRRKLSEGYVIIHPAQFRVLVFRKGSPRMMEKAAVREARGKVWKEGLGALALLY